MPAKQGSKNNIKRLPGYFYAFVVIPAKARLHGYTPAWMQVVEPRLEQAAEVVEPCLERRPRNPVVDTRHSRLSGNARF